MAVVIRHIHIFLQDKVREESYSISITPPKSETHSQNFATQKFKIWSLCSFWQVFFNVLLRLYRCFLELIFWHF